MFCQLLAFLYGSFLLKMEKNKSKNWLAMKDTTYLIIIYEVNRRIQSSRYRTAALFRSAQSTNMRYSPDDCHFILRCCWALVAELRFDDIPVLPPKQKMIHILFWKVNDLVIRCSHIWPITEYGLILKFRFNFNQHIKQRTCVTLQMTTRFDALLKSYGVDGIPMLTSKQKLLYCSEGGEGSLDTMHSTEFGLILKSKCNHGQNINQRIRVSTDNYPFWCVAELIFDNKPVLASKRKMLYILFWRGEGYFAMMHSCRTYNSLV